GPHFLESLIEQINQSEYLNMTTFSESLELQKELPIVQCSRGAWGANGNDDSWLNEHTKSIWENIHHAEKMMNEILEEGNPPGRFKQRIAELALRELMLMQASDWTWLISMKKASDYARERFEEHYVFFEQLTCIFRSMGDREHYTEEELIILQKIEKRDDILNDINIDDWHYSSA
ncbi:MAG: 1,4-alpha-glucan branching protein domain-containing protein, partial [Candidatus Kapaibacteriota bacterium]